MEVQCALPHGKGLGTKERQLGGERVAVEDYLGMVLEGGVLCADLGEGQGRGYTATSVHASDSNTQTMLQECRHIGR